MVIGPSEASEGMGAPRGRPPRISREHILDAGVTLLEQEASNAPPSLNGIARALKITPMAIYTYFKSKDELWQALGDRLMAEFDPAIPPGADPFTQIRLWALAMRGHLLRRPQLINMLVWEGGHSSIGWLRRAMVVPEALDALGLEERDHARVTIWVWHVVMGAINVELHNRTAPQELATEEIDALEEPLQGRVRRLLAVAREADYPDTFFTFQIDRMLDALRMIEPGRS